MTIFDSILLLGAIQGFVSTILILRSKNGNALASRLIAALLFLLSLAIINICLLESGVQYRVPEIRIVGYILPLTVVMPIGPLLYLYVRTIVSGQKRFSRLHFLPVIVDMLPYAIGILYVISNDVATVISTTPNEWVSSIDAAHAYVDIPRWISLIIYSVVSLRLLFNLPPTQRKHSTSLIALVIAFCAFQLVWLGHLIPYLIPATQLWLLSIVGWYPVYVPLAALVYAAGLFGLIGHRSLRLASSTDTEAIKNMTGKLIELMTNEKLYLNSNLTLDDVVQKLKTNQKILSAALSQELRQNFNDYVNRLRVNEFKCRLASGNYQHLTLTGLALECGFNSNATFNRAFKKSEGTTPSHYRRQNQTKKMLHS